jgi:hypothetical protein
MALAFQVNLQNTDAHGSNSKNAVALKSDTFWQLRGNTAWPACVQVNFVQALLPEFPKESNYCIISPKSKQTPCRDSVKLIPFCFLFVLCRPWKILNQ